MAQIDSVLLNMESTIKNADVVKEMVLDRLQKEGLISEEQKTEFCEKWQVIVVKRSWYKTWWKKFFSTDDDGISDEQGREYQYKLVKFED